MLKAVKVPLHNGDRVMETYAVLDDGSERTIVLPQVVQQLHLTRQPEVLYLRTIQQEVVERHGTSVNLHISPLHQPAKKYKVSQVITADSWSMVEHSYPVAAIQKCYEHLRGLPLPPVDHARPLLLIGLDMPHLLTPIRPVHVGPSGAPVAICTKFGWTL